MILVSCDTVAYRKLLIIKMNFSQYVGKHKSVFQCAACLVQKQVECFVVKLMFLGF